MFLDKKSIDNILKGKRVFNNGAGGSIGSELVRQCSKFLPSLIVMVDNSEYNLFQVDRELNTQDTNILYKPVLSDIRDKLNSEKFLMNLSRRLFSMLQRINTFLFKKIFLMKP